MQSDLAEKTLMAALRVKRTIATAESCTGGIVSAALTEIPGSSDVVVCGFTTYANSAKEMILDVAPDTLARHGAVSIEVAEQMARGAVARSDARTSISITGIAGPGGSDFKPEGRVCFALFDGPTNTCLTEMVEFGVLGRTRVRTAARDYALGMLIRFFETQ
jgi:nicotinamide-nucleotide amidase